MKRVPVALELQVTVDNPSAVATAALAGGKPGLPRALGIAPLALPGGLFPESQWYSVEGGALVGVDAHAGVVSADQIQVTISPQAGVAAAALAAPAIAVEASQPALGHDFRMLHSEVAMASRFLVELSYLTGLLNQVLSEAAVDADHLLFDDRLRLRREVVNHLLAGQSLLEYPGFMLEFGGAVLDADLLFFDILDISVHSPLFARLRPYVAWDPKVGINTLFSAILLLHSFGPTYPSDVPAQPLTCAVVETRLAVPASNFAASCQIYRRDLEAGGEQAMQKFLRMLTYDVGPIDGIAGPVTQAAVARFCSDRGIECTDSDAAAFREALVTAVARKAPLPGG